MKTKRSNSCGLTALTYALVLLMGDVVAQGSNSKESCIANLLGDGHCDRSQNIEICGGWLDLNGRKRWYQIGFWADLIVKAIECKVSTLNNIEKHRSFIGWQQIGKLKSQTLGVSNNIFHSEINT